MPVKNLISQKFYRLLVVSRFGSNSYRQATWNCICDCGNTAIVSTNALVTGNTKSCGCYHLDKITKHGNYLHPLYDKWISIKSRCYNSNDGSYKNYGGRGIRMSKSWYHSFKQFVNDMGIPPSKNHTIDRIDNNKGYNKQNCRWATRKEQNNNTRQNVFISYKGKTKTTSQWAEEIGIPSSRIRQRLKNGKTIPEIFDVSKRVNQYR